MEQTARGYNPTEGTNPCVQHRSERFHAQVYIQLFVDDPNLYEAWGDLTYLRPIYASEVFPEGTRGEGEGRRAKHVQCECFLLNEITMETLLGRFAVNAVTSASKIPASN
jgi:hypothetical protein